MCDRKRRGRALASGVRVLQLPQRLPLQLPAVAGSAPLRVDAPAGHDFRGVGRIGKVGRGASSRRSRRPDQQDSGTQRRRRIPAAHGDPCTSAFSSVVSCDDGGLSGSTLTRRPSGAMT